MRFSDDRDNAPTTVVRAPRRAMPATCERCRSGTPRQYSELTKLYYCDRCAHALNTIRDQAMEEPICTEVESPPTGTNQ